MCWVDHSPFCSYLLNLEEVLLEQYIETSQFATVKLVKLKVMEIRKGNNKKII